MLILISSFHSFGQEIQTNLDSLIKYVYWHKIYPDIIEHMVECSKSAIYIKTPQKSGTGTLFCIINNPEKDTSGATVLLATAKHVLEATDSTGKLLGYFKEADALIKVIGGKVESKKYGHLQYFKNSDIAILKPIEFRSDFNEYDTFTITDFDIATFSEITQGQTVFIAGYPFGRGVDSIKLTPVIQTGIIAFVDTSKSLVLIDIPINYGNSGSPVYTIVQNNIKLVGLVFAYEENPQDSVYSSVYQRKIPVNASLGRVVTLFSALKEIRQLTK